MIKEFDIDKMIQEGCLLTAGTINNYNTMTIGWGMIGTIWRKKTFIAYVKPCRYTYQFMENNEYFTISFYDKEYKKEASANKNRHHSMPIFFVELEGIEPSSKRGNNVLSTCLSLPSFSSRNKPRATNHELIS